MDSVGGRPAAAGPAHPPRTRRVIVPNPDGSGWHWGEEPDDSA